MPVGAHYKSLGRTGRKTPWAGPKKPAGDATIAVLLRMAMVALAIYWMPVERALAEQARFLDLTDTVSEGQGVTFGDLVQLVAIGKSDIRHIGGDGWSSPGPEIIKLLNVAAVPVLSSRSDRMVLLLDFDPAQYSASGFVVLAHLRCRERTRTVAVTYRWDAARQRYFADSDALDVLERENEQRF